MKMRTAHVQKMLAKYFTTDAVGRRNILARVYATGGYEALQAAAYIVGISLTRAMAMAGVTARQREYNRRGRKNWHKDVALANEIAREAEQAAGGRGELRYARRDASASAKTDVRGRRARVIGIYRDQRGFLDWQAAAILLMLFTVFYFWVK